jgi:hypothetical protein
LSWSVVVPVPCVRPVDVRVVCSRAGRVVPKWSPTACSSFRTVIGRALRSTLITAGRRVPEAGSRRVGELVSGAGRGRGPRTCGLPTRQAGFPGFYSLGQLSLGRSPPVIPKSALTLLKKASWVINIGIGLQGDARALTPAVAARYLCLCTCRCTRLRGGVALCRSQFAMASPAGLAGQDARRPGHSPRTLSSATVGSSAWDVHRDRRPGTGGW